MACISSVNRRAKNGGFTLVEVLVIAPIVMIAIAIMIAVLITLTGEIIRIQGNTKTVDETQAAMSQIEEDVRLSTQFMSTSYGPVSPQGITGTTNFDGSSSFSIGGSSPARLILRSLTTTTSPTSSNKQIIYRNSPICSGLNAIPYNVDIVYYLKSDNTLWRRVIDPSLNSTNGVPAPCSTPWQAPSCSPGYSAAVCKAEDTKIADNITAMSVNYLNSAGTSIGSTPSASAAAMKVSLTTTTTIAGRTDTYTPQSSVLKLYSADPDLAVSTWNPLTLQNNWAYFGGGFSTAAYTITSSGVVMLKGLIYKTSGTPATSETIGVLPAGYRPSKQLLFSTSTSPNTASRVDISPAGQIQFVIGSGGWLSLDGISFVPPTAGYTFTAPTLSNNWVNFDANSYVPAGIAVDRSGRVQAQGLVANGVTTDGTLISSVLNNTLRSDKYLHLSTALTNGFGFIGISDTSGTYPSGILAKGGSNSFLSLNRMYYPSSYSGSWSPLTLYSGWLPYPGGSLFSNGQYIKGSDGVVSLRGLIYAGATGAETGITYLPVGYRPKERIVVNAANYGVYGRIDIRPDGWVVTQAVNNTWLSLDGINFPAEQ